MYKIFLSISEEADAQPQERFISLESLKVFLGFPTAQSTSDVKPAVQVDAVSEPPDKVFYFDWS